MDFKKDINPNTQKDVSGNPGAISLSSIHTRFFETAAKKTERVVTALYMVSNILQDTEPLKGELRKWSVALLSAAQELSVRRYDNSLFETVAISIKKIMSCLEIAGTLSFVSDMNYRILRREMLALLAAYESKNTMLTLNTEELFKETKEEPTPKSVVEKKPSVFGIYYKGHIKDIKNSIKDNTLVKHTKNVSYGDDDKKSESTDGNERKNKILNLLKSRPLITINEISVEIKNVSDKTIQRDLQSMIDEGVVERIGERRWSRYSVKG